jgi:uncharacterized membrane protein YraQ (UPF0718 family)
MSTLTTPLKTWPARQPIVFLVAASIGWLTLYQALDPAAEALVATLPVDRASHLGGALQFFFYDTPKVLMLLTGVVFVMGMVNSYFTPERTRAMLAGRSEGVANVMAASLGIVTPFCSCSAVPLFIGFVQAGVPLGVTFSFLISAPMVNEVALTLLFGMFGWKVALLYLGLGLSVAIVAGWIIGWKTTWKTGCVTCPKPLPHLKTAKPLWQIAWTVVLPPCARLSARSGPTFWAALPSVH